MIRLIILGLAVIFNLELGIASTVLSKKLEIGASNITIDEFSTCKKITNTSNKALFIPVKTSREWESFVAHPPAGIIVGACTVNDYTWKIGRFQAPCESGLINRSVQCIDGLGAPVDNSLCTETKPVSSAACPTMTAFSDVGLGGVRSGELFTITASMLTVKANESGLLPGVKTFGFRVTGMADSLEMGRINLTTGEGQSIPNSSIVSLRSDGTYVDGIKIPSTERLYFKLARNYDEPPLSYSKRVNVATFRYQQFDSEGLVYETENDVAYPFLAYSPAIQSSRAGTDGSHIYYQRKGNFAYNYHIGCSPQVSPVALDYHSKAFSTFAGTVSMTVSPYSKLKEKDFILAYRLIDSQKGELFYLNSVGAMVKILDYSNVELRSDGVYINTSKVSNVGFVYWRPTADIIIDDTKDYTIVDALRLKVRVYDSTGLKYETSTTNTYPYISIPIYLYSDEGHSWPVWGMHGGFKYVDNYNFVEYSDLTYVNVYPATNRGLFVLQGAENGGTPQRNEITSFMFSGIPSISNVFYNSGTDTSPNYQPIETGELKEDGVYLNNSKVSNVSKLYFKHNLTLTNQGQKAVKIIGKYKSHCSGTMRESAESFIEIMN